MNDLIGRQVALNALGERPTVWTDDDDYALGERNQYDMDRRAIETVPSTQPDVPDTNVGDNLNVDELIKFLNPESNYVFYDEAHGFCINTQDVLDHLCAMPSAQPGWIPVTEKLPEKDGEYYVTQLRYDVYDSKMTGSHVRETNHIWYSISHKRWSVMATCKVVAWMPLPPKWEGEKK